jgi:hypothetical protein
MNATLTTAEIREIEAADHCTLFDRYIHPAKQAADRVWYAAYQGALAERPGDYARADRVSVAAAATSLEGRRHAEICRVARAVGKFN